PVLPRVVAALPERIEDPEGIEHRAGQLKGGVCLAVLGRPGQRGAQVAAFGVEPSPQIAGSVAPVGPFRLNRQFEIMCGVAPGSLSVVAGSQFLCRELPYRFQHDQPRRTAFAAGQRRVDRLKKILVDERLDDSGESQVRDMVLWRPSTVVYDSFLADCRRRLECATADKD